MDKPKTFTPGYTFADFELVEYLGGGQDGEVWKATRTSIDSTVAIKFLNANDPEKIERFRKEIRMLAKLQHANIVGIQERNEAPHPTTGQMVPCYVMDYLQGEPLDKALQNTPTDQRLTAFCTYLDQTIDALQTAHLVGIAHGDIKPANVLIARNGRIAKLADFGFGLFDGEARTRTEYPSSSFQAPPDLTPRDADLYRLGKTIEVCAALLRDDERIALAIAQLVTDLTNVSITADVAKERLGTIRELPRQLASFFTEASAIPEFSASTKTILRDGIYGDIALTDRVRALLDTPAFQRLRNIRLFPTAELVYPSLTTSLLEETIGEFGAIRRYTPTVLADPRISGAVGREHIEALVLVVLLRHIGVPPYRDALNVALAHDDVDGLTASAIMSPPISTVIEKHWRLAPRLVAELLLGRGGALPTRAWQVVSWIVRYPYAPANTEWVRRVDHHAGFPTTVDYDRLYRGLTVEPENEDLSVRASAINELVNVMSARTLTLERVIEHRTVRAANSMLRAALAELSAGTILTLARTESDDEFLRTCAALAEQNGQLRAARLARDVRERRLFRLAYSHFPSRANMWYRPLAARQATALRLVRLLAHETNTSPDDILVDIPPPRFQHQPNIVPDQGASVRNELIDALAREADRRRASIAVFVSRQVDEDTAEQVRRVAEAALGSMRWEAGEF